MSRHELRMKSLCSNHRDYLIDEMSLNLVRSVTADFIDTNELLSSKNALSGASLSDKFKSL